MEVTTLDNTELRRLTLLSLGDPQVGKTTLLDRYCLGLVGFQRVWTTQTVDVHAKMLHCPRGLITAEIFDVAGDAADNAVGDLILRLIADRRSHAVVDVRSAGRSQTAQPPTRRRGSVVVHGVLLWFDVSNKHSLGSVGRWAAWVRDRLVDATLAQTGTGPAAVVEASRAVGEIPVFVIGNKLDKLKDKLAGRTCEVSLADVKRYHDLLAEVRRGLDKKTQHQMGDNLFFTSRNEDLAPLDDILLNLYDLNSQQNKARAFLFHLQTVPLSSLAGPDPRRLAIPSMQSVLPAFRREIQKQTTRVMKAIWRQGSRHSPDRARSQSASRRVQFADQASERVSADGSQPQTPARPTREHSPEHETGSPTLRQRTKTRSKSMLREALAPVETAKCSGEPATHTPG